MRLPSRQRQKRRAPVWPPVQSLDAEQLRYRWVTAHVKGPDAFPPLQWGVDAVLRAAELRRKDVDDVMAEWWAEVRELRPSAGVWAG